MNLQIRDFRHTDTEHLVHLHKIAFSEEARVDGLTPGAQAERLRFIARGRMIPFRFLTALAGYKWGLLVAEADGKIVGTAMFVGRRKKVEFSTLAVAPEHRRRGIGTALLRERLRRATQMRVSYATSTVLPSNAASIGNLRKQGFEVYDRTTEYDLPLPLPDTLAPRVNGITSRPIRLTDRSAFDALEQRMVSPAVLEVEGTSANGFFPSLRQRLLFRWGRTRLWARVFERDGLPMGFVYADAVDEATKGFLYRPVIASDETDVYHAMQWEAASWMAGLGKSAMRVSISGDHPNIAAGENVISWLMLMKRLDGRDMSAGAELPAADQSNSK
jgi:ribosomal protein S18 acetylase RimI-like enzyme